MFGAITNKRSFFVNSFYCQYTNTNFIAYNIDVENSYLDSVNRIAITDLFIPSTKIYQFDPSDVFTLKEGMQQVEIKLPYANYQEYQDLVDDLHKLLNENSPNGFLYTITLLKNQLAMKIEVNSLTNIQILIPEKSHLIIAYGLNEINTFVNGSLTSTIISKTPIDEIFISSNGVLGFSTTDIASSILAVYDMKVNEMQKFDLLSASKNFSRTRRLTFALGDFDGDLLDLNGKHWYLELQLFHYDEAFVTKLRTFIDFITFDMMTDDKKQKNEKENQIKKDNANLSSLL